MGREEEQPIRKGDRSFLFRLLGGAALVVVLGAFVLLLMDKSRLGSCAARGFQELTVEPPSD